MARTAITFFAVLVALAAAIFQLAVKPKLAFLGRGRVIKPVGNTNCKTYPELQACEKIVLHQPTGHLYLACSTPASRTHWMPAMTRYNVTGKGYGDYVAVFDPAKGSVTKLERTNFKYPRGLSLHGMDVVQSSLHPEDILIYLVNHRPPLDPAVDANTVGADSVVEIFKTKAGGKEMVYVATFKDPVISTPNDIVGTGDDMSFFFTNDHGTVKTGFARKYLLDIFLNRPWSNVGYCHALNGCKIAYDGVIGANGIAWAKDDRILVSSTYTGQIFVLEQQSDMSLVLADVIQTDRPLDNISVDKTGAIWAAGIPNAEHRGTVHFEDPSVHNPSTALRITPNKDESQYFGEKFKIETVFEDAGEVASGATSVVYDTERKKLFLHGVASPHLTVCDL